MRDRCHFWGWSIAMNGGLTIEACGRDRSSRSGRPGKLHGPAARQFCVREVGVFRIAHGSQGGPPLLPINQAPKTFLQMLLHHRR